ncbi:MAG: ATP-binding cassette domain-containing protein, partial [Candidatus Cloacimonetes bacterium]|nr:ATP-binding cassette domain-containing protein [Candidatus Cloacimonadota bacterium]
MVDLQLQTQDLNLWFGKNHVLHDVNLPVQTHRVTAMIGPSGCGKSTLLRCFNRMNDLIPTTRVSGKVLLGN